MSASQVARVRTFAQALQRMLTVLGQLAPQMADLADVYFARGFQSGGSDPIVDADVLEHGLTAGVIGDAVNLCQQLRNFMEGEPVLQSAWGQIVNKVREDI